MNKEQQTTLTLSYSQTVSDSASHTAIVPMAMLLAASLHSRTANIKKYLPQLHRCSYLITYLEFYKRVYTFV